MTLKEIAAIASNTGGPIAGHHEVNAEGAGVSFATHIVDVDLDRDTGSATIARYTVLQDAGKAVHPSYVEGQFLGSSFKCNTQSPLGIGCCDGHTKQAPQQRGTWRDISRA
jgi:CO/xanthine dehydrogenase Mo-binding subunit